MQVVGKFNAISEELKKQIPALEVGQTITFEMLTGQKNNDPDEKERQKSPMLYPKANIPLRDRIKDPYIKEGSSWVDIVVADSWDRDGNPRERFFMPGISDGSGDFKFGGKFSLTGGNQRDEELYEFLMISNWNQDSIIGEGGRDKSKAPMCKVINQKVTSQKVMTGFNTLKEAINIVTKLKPSEARQIGASLNWNEFTDDEVILAQVADLARTKPEEFLRVYNDPNKPIKASVRKALDSDVLKFDIATGKVTLGSQEITTISKEDRGNVTEALTQFINSAKNGKQVLDNINKQLTEPETV
jgi:hypothetical protein